MSSCILCQTPRARQPYFIQNIQMNIYSIEELCYYLYHNLYLVDRTLFNEELCFWISTELKLPLLGQKIRPFLGKFSSLEDLVYPIFKEINYLSYEELKKLNAQLREMDELSLTMRRKKKGDAFMENGMYIKAIDMYTGLINEGLKEEDPSLAACISHNLGCAYANLFQMEKAADYFRKAFELSHEDEELEYSLLALSSYSSKDKAVEEEASVGNVQINPQIKDKVRQILEQFESTPAPDVEEGRMDAFLEGFMKEYHRSTSK
ncbi:MAG: hypothetical protein IKE58_06960 [Blautia sp.]|nr:hypothetical protein [Blautia sp.]